MLIPHDIGCGCCGCVAASEKLMQELHQRHLAIVAGLPWKDKLTVERMRSLAPMVMECNKHIPANCTRITALAEFDDGEMIHLNIERKPEEKCG